MRRILRYFFRRDIESIEGFQKRTHISFLELSQENLLLRDRVHNLERDNERLINKWVRQQDQINSINNKIKKQ